MEKSSMLAGNIFTNPIGWAGTMVGTKLRFAFSLIYVPGFILLVLSNISDAPLMEHWSSALLIVVLQVMFLYSMRKMFLKLTTIIE